LYKRVCEELISNVDKLQKLSLENFEVYRLFYFQKCRQLEIKINNKLVEKK
jgi:hypothetical protein